MSPRAAGATQHELSRIGLLASLPGETLVRLAQNMTREEIPAGAGVVAVDVVAEMDRAVVDLAVLADEADRDEVHDERHHEQR